MPELTLGIITGTAEILESRRTTNRFTTVGNTIHRIGQPQPLTSPARLTRIALGKEASGRRLFYSLSYTQEVRGSSPLPPTTKLIEHLIQQNSSNVALSCRTRTNQDISCQSKEIPVSSLNTLMISMLSLFRQRNQITVFIYHYPRMVDVGILAYLDGVFIKEPSVWDVYYGQKGDLLPKLTWKAAELFENMDENKRKSAVFVSAPQAKFEGMLENPLPSYWCHDVSKAWAGFQDQQLPFTHPRELEVSIDRVTKGWRVDDPEMKTTYPVSAEMLKRGKVVEEHPFQDSCYVIMEDGETGIRWVKRVY